jgi:hypothetical protein
MSLPYDAISKGLVEIDPASWPALTGHAGGAVEVIDADISTGPRCPGFRRLHPGLYCCHPQGVQKHNREHRTATPEGWKQ